MRGENSREGEPEGWGLKLGWSFKCEGERNRFSGGNDIARPER